MADELTTKATRWVVSFTLRSLYPRRKKSIRYS
jgi:hypothetical protein